MGTSIKSIPHQDQTWVNLHNWYWKLWLEALIYHGLNLKEVLTFGVVNRVLVNPEGQISQAVKMERRCTAVAGDTVIKSQYCHGRSLLATQGLVRIVRQSSLSRCKHAMNSLLVKSCFLSTNIIIIIGSIFYLQLKGIFGFRIFIDAHSKEFLRE